MNLIDEGESFPLRARRDRIQVEQERTALDVLRDRTSRDDILSGCHRAHHDLRASDGIPYAVRDSHTGRSGGATRDALPIGKLNIPC